MELALKLLENKLLSCINELNNENHQLKAVQEEIEVRKSKIDTLNKNIIELESALLVLTRNNK